jgi:hypothetical protein
LRGESKHVSSLQHESYEALSYAWGELTDTHDIIINAGFNRLPLTANLHDALQRLRNPHLQRILWIDAICINQDNAAEKSKQIGKMPVIFANAIHVIVWLGDEDSTTNGKSVVDALKRLKRYWYQTHEAGPFTIQGWRKTRRKGLVYAGGKSSRILSSRQERHLKSLLRRSWFRRSWVVQEVAVARKTYVQFGVNLVEWEAFQIVFIDVQDQKLVLSQLDDETVSRACSNIAAIENTRRTYASKRREPSLFNLLVDTHLNECTDPRDKVYSLLGIAKDYQICLEKQSPVPDYSVTTTSEIAFIRFATWDILSNDTLRVLSCASGPGGYSQYAILGSKLGGDEQSLSIYPA